MDDDLYDIREDALELIERSTIDDFDGDAGAWAVWCREIAVAAISGDVVKLAGLTMVSV